MKGFSLKRLHEETRLCAHCGEAFKPKYKSQEFCSEECELSYLEELQDFSEALWYIEDL